MLLIDAILGIKLINLDNAWISYVCVLLHSPTQIFLIICLLPRHLIMQAN